MLAVKAHQVGAIAADLAALCHAETSIVTMQNGIPWWYFHKHGGAYEGTPVRSRRSRRLDRAHDRRGPRHRRRWCIRPRLLEAPGVVHVVEGKRFTLGEPDGSTSARAQAISAAFTRAGFKAPVIADIRSEIWLKLWGNLELQSDQRADARDARRICCQFPAHARAERRR